MSDAKPDKKRFFKLLESPLQKWAGTQNFFSNKSLPYSTRFDDTLANRRKLIIWGKPQGSPISYREIIVNHFSQNNFLLTTVATGAGKTTQLPSLLLEASGAIWKDDNNSEKDIKQEMRKIVCTQPKRLNAKTNAERVSVELDVTLGGVVGYQIGGGVAKKSSATLLEFVTAGILVQKFSNPRDFFNEYKAIAIDEVHERSAETDLLMAYLRYYIIEKGMGKDFKILIMSATIPENVKTNILNYFKLDPKKDYLNVPGTQNDIVVTWRKKPVPNYIDFCAQMAIEAQYLGNYYCPPSSCGETLIFLAGAPEMTAVEEKITNLLQTDRYIELNQVKPLIIRRIVGGTNNDDAETKATLEKPASDFILENGKNAWGKIILATNAAESGITFYDVDSVIDSGLRKLMTFCPFTNQHIFLTNHVSYNSLIQRRGRVGRKKKGFAFPAMTENYALSELPPEDPPAIIAQDFTISALRFLSSGLLPFELPLLTDPSPEQVSSSWRNLLYLGFVDPNRQTITTQGIIASKLCTGQTTPCQAKMIIEGIKNKCVGEMIVIVAMLQSLQAQNSLRYFGEDGKLKVKVWPPDPNLLTFSNPKNGSGIDHLVLLEVFEKTMEVPFEDRKRWCAEQQINYKTIEYADEFKRSLIEILLDSNIGISFISSRKNTSTEISNYQPNDNNNYNNDNNNYNNDNNDNNYKKNKPWYEPIRECIFNANILKYAKRYSLPPKSGIGAVYKSVAYNKLFGYMESKTEASDKMGWAIFNEKNTTNKPPRWPPYGFCYETLLTKETQGKLKNNFSLICTIPEDIERQSPFILF